MARLARTPVNNRKKYRQRRRRAAPLINKWGKYQKCRRSCFAAVMLSCCSDERLN
jgi:hypothetical protein